MRLKNEEIMPINAIFDETGLELEKIIKDLLICQLHSAEELQNCCY